MNGAVHDYAIKITVRNNRMLAQMQLIGIPTAAALSRASGVSMGCVCQFLRLQRAPIRKNEQWSVALLKISECLRCLPEDLFPAVHLRAPLKKSFSEFTADAADIDQISASLRSMALPSDEKMMITESKKALDELLLHKLLPREGRVLRMRFGLDDGVERTLDEIAKRYDISQCRVRQIEAMAVRKLKHAVGADKAMQITLGRRLPPQPPVRYPPQPPVRYPTYTYTRWPSYRAPPLAFKSPVPTEGEKAQGSAGIKSPLEKYLGCPGDGSLNPYATQ